MTGRRGDEGASGGGAPAARARAYVSAHGDARAALRAGVLGGSLPPEALGDALASWQGPGGGFVPLDGVPHLAQEGVGPTVMALRQCAQAGLLAGPVVEGAAGFLARVQAQDGSWRPARTPGAAPDGADADPFAQTAAAGAALARLRCASPAVLARADAFLSRAFAPERIEGADASVLASCAAFFSNGPFERADEVLQWCGRTLEKGYRSGAFDAVAAVGVLVACDAPSLPGGRLDASGILPGLLALQAEDGAFAPPGVAAAERVEATLLALCALRRFAPDAPRR